MNPYQVANENHIVVISEDLGKVYGYYKKTEGQKFIHINETLPPYYQRFITAHLLYPALYLPDDMYFVKQKLGARFTETEKRADIFAFRMIFDPAEYEAAGSYRAIMQNIGMAESDINDLSSRLKRVWETAAGNDIESQIRYAVEQLEQS